MNREIYNVCSNCGIKANRLTCLKKYKAHPKQEAFTVSTYHNGKCDMCKKKTSVTEARDFFYPDFSLIRKPEDVTFDYLIDCYSDKEIVSRLLELYPKEKKNIKGYKEALKELREKRPRKKDMNLVLTKYKEDGEKWTSVDGVDDKGQMWGLDMTRWSGWLAMGIGLKTLKNFPEIDIIAHALWEMTFHGYTDREIKNFGKMLTGRIKSVNKDQKGVTNGKTK